MGSCVRHAEISFQQRISRGSNPDTRIRGEGRGIYLRLTMETTYVQPCSMKTWKVERCKLISDTPRPVCGGMTARGKGAGGPSDQEKGSFVRV